MRSAKPVYRKRMIHALPREQVVAAIQFHNRQGDISKRMLRFF